MTLLPSIADNDIYGSIEDANHILAISQESGVDHIRGYNSKLSLYTRPFDNFAHSRNFALSKVATEYALILDADERLYPEDFKELKRTMKAFPSTRYSFDFEIIDQPGEHVSYNTSSMRLFKVTPYTRYEGKALENFNCSHWEWMTLEVNTRVKIKHYNPAAEVRKQKDNFYKRLRRERKTIFR